MNWLFKKISRRAYWNQKIFTAGHFVLCRACSWLPLIYLSFADFSGTTRLLYTQIIRKINIQVESWRIGQTTTSSWFQAPISLISGLLGELLLQRHLSEERWVRVDALASIVEIRINYNFVQRNHLTLARDPIIMEMVHFIHILNVLWYSAADRVLLLLKLFHWHTKGIVFAVWSLPTTVILSSILRSRKAMSYNDQ